MLIFTFSEKIFRLGKNAKENFELIDDADPNDWWFHLADEPSGHCIVDAEVIDKSMIIYAANLVKDNSKLKNNKKVKVVFTQIKNIKKTKTLGTVIVNKYQGEIVI